jgi:hypothetical protein
MHDVMRLATSAVLIVAAAVRAAGGTLAHSLMALRIYDEKPE